MPGSLAKDAKTHIPFCADQGMPNLVAASARGLALQKSVTTMPGASPQVVTFASLGLSDMADGLYAATAHNHTSNARVPTITSKTATGFTITNPSAADVLDIIIVGTLKDQLA